MKLLIPFILIFVITSAEAQNHYRLLIKKKNQQEFIDVNNTVSLEYTNGGFLTIKGRLIDLKDSSLILKTFGRNAQVKEIPLSSVNGIKKTFRGAKAFTGPLAILSIGTAIGFLVTNRNRSGTFCILCPNSNYDPGNGGTLKAAFSTIPALPYIIMSMAEGNLSSKENGYTIMIVKQ